MYRDTAMTYAQQLHEVKLLSLDRRLTSLMSKIKQGAPSPKNVCVKCLHLTIF